MEPCEKPGAFMGQALEIATRKGDEEAVRAILKTATAAEVNWKDVVSIPVLLFFEFDYLCPN